MKRRCEWCENHPLNIVYHDTEWGVPSHDDRHLFEHLVLGGAQAGLSWITILKRREGYRQAFDSYDVEKIARYGEEDLARLLQDPGIIRNKQKVTSVIKNARAFLKIQEEFGSFDAFIWRFVDGKPIKNQWVSLEEIPPKTKESEALSKELIRRGFQFIGPTIVYAVMQGVGMVNDHATYCFRYDEVG